MKTQSNVKAKNCKDSNSLNNNFLYAATLLAIGLVLTGNLDQTTPMVFLSSIVVSFLFVNYRLIAKYFGL